MPTYDYRCKKCEHAFEHFQSMSSRLLRKCPECGEKSLERLIGTGGGLIFKGSGFYITDYRGDSYEKEKTSDSSDASKSDSSSKKDETKSKSKTPEPAKKNSKTGKGKESSSSEG